MAPVFANLPGQPCLTVCFDRVDFNEAKSGYKLSQQHKQKRNERSKDLGMLLDSCSEMTLAIFCRLRIKNSLMQTKSIEIWVNFTLTQYHTMHVSILDHIRHLNFDLSTCQGHSRSNVIVSLDSSYVLFPINA